MPYRMIADSCPNGPCPKIRIDTDTGDAFVSGYLTDREPEPTPAGEGVLRIPAEAWTTIHTQLKKA